MVAFGMVDGFTMSSTADLGSYFYLSRGFLASQTNVLSDGTTYFGGTSGTLYTSYASSSLVCMVPRQVRTLALSGYRAVLDF